MEEALAPATRRTYAVGAKLYQAYCAARALDPLAITVERAAEWLTSVGKEARISPGALVSYKCGVQSWLLERTRDQDLPRVFDHLVVKRVLDGASRALRAAMLARPQEEPPLPLTTALLAQVRHVMLPVGASHEQRMIWAAVRLAVVGLLRPNEFVGAYQSEDRAIRPHQLRFYDEHGEQLDIGAEAARPARFTLTLGATKADQLAHNAPIPITEEETVKAVWDWAGLRRRLGETREQFFVYPGARALSINRLNTAVREALQAIGRGATIKGRSYRRGGARSLVDAGNSLAAVKAAGRWKGDAMVQRYAGATPAASPVTPATFKIPAGTSTAR